MSIFSLYAAQFSNGPVVLSQVFSKQLEMGLGLYKMGGSGQIYDQFVTAMTGKPMVKLTTTQLNTAFTACGMSGLVFKTAATANELQCFSGSDSKTHSTTQPATKRLLSRSDSWSRRR